jgi:cyclopropane-fatty-acyl-phospholipid synthase
VHTIGRVGLTNRHDPFIQKYIFPASSTPALSEIAAQLERNELAILDVENIKNHYGYTTGAWLERFMANRDRLDDTRFDGRFKRMWEYYLACGVAAAFVSDSAVYQVVFTSDYTAPVPLARV